MLSHRVIPCLDVKDGRVVKGVRFEGLRDAGDPIELARRYDAEGADELCFLDITASSDRRSTLVHLVEAVSRELCIPFTVGGGIRSLDDMRVVLEAGADKVSVGTAALRDPDLIARAAAEFGSQFLVVSLDARSNPDGSVHLTTHGGREDTGIDAVDFARRMAAAGAGEILLNDIDRDGTCDGFGLSLLARICAAVDIPVIASGGAGQASHFADAVIHGGAAAVLAASVFHRRELSVADVKRAMAQAGLPVRPVAPVDGADSSRFLAPLAELASQELS